MDLLDELKSIIESESINSHAFDLLLHICKQTDQDKIVKCELLDHGILEIISELYSHSTALQQKTFLVSVIKWLCQGDQDAKLKVHSHGYAKYLLSLLFEDCQEKENLHENENADLHAAIFQVLAEISNSSPQLQQELWSLGLLDVALKMLKIWDPKPYDSHQNCCHGDAALSSCDKKLFENILMGKELFGKFSRIDPKTRTDIRLPVEMNIHAYEAQLFRKTGEKLLPLANELIKSKGVWAKNGMHATILGCDSYDSDDDEETIVKKDSLLVTGVVSPNLLTGYLGGSKTLQKVKEISEKLAEAFSSSPVPWKESQSKENLVFFPFVITDGMEWKRGFVLDVKDGKAKIFCMDYGELVIVSADVIYELTKYIKAIPPQVSLFSIRGLYPLPRGRNAILQASRILRIFCSSWHFFIGEIEAKHNFADIINLCRLPWSDVLVNTIASLEALAAHNKEIKEKLGRIGIIQVLHDILLDQLENNRIVHATLGCLLNLFVESAQNRKIAAANSIFPSLVFALQKLRDPELRCRCTSTIKNLVGNQWDLLHPTDIRSIQGSGMGYHSIKLDLAKTHAREQRSKTELKADPVYKALTVDDIVDAVAWEDLSTSSLSSDNDIDSCDGPCETNHESARLRQEESIYRTRDISEKFFHQDFMPLSHEILYEIRSEQNLKMASEESIVKTVCAMLNTHRRGCIVFGLEQNARIIGVNIERKQRDNFRLALDKMLQRLSPKAKQAEVKVQFVPVMEKPKGKCVGLVELVQVEERHVIIIDVCGVNGILHQWRGDYFFREKNSNFTLTVDKLRASLVKEMGDKYKAEIRRLQNLIAEKERIHYVEPVVTQPFSSGPNK